MTNPPDFEPTYPDGEPAAPERPLDESTMDLSGFDDASLDDLQAFADQVAEVTPDESEEQREAARAADKVRIADMDAKAKADHERYLRLLSDFQNYRNRHQKEIQLAVDVAEKRLLLEILPVLDNVDRCLASTYHSVEDFRAGVELIRKQFMDHLRRLGVEPVVLAVGDPFDAQHSEALTTRSDARLPDGSVADVYERGFTLRDMLLRPARVVVNHNPGAEGCEAGSDPGCLPEYPS